MELITGIHELMVLLLTRNYPRNLEALKYYDVVHVLTATKYRA